MLRFHWCFFTDILNQWWANLFNRRVICRKSKTPASRKTSLLRQYKYGKKCKFYIKWSSVIVSIKFLFDFLDPENLDSMLLKLCEVILPNVHFSVLHDGLILRTSWQRKKFHSNMLCFPQKWVIHWYFKFWIFAFWNLLTKIKCRVALTKVIFDLDFLAFRSVLFLQQTSLWQTVNQLNSHHWSINIEWVCKECKAWF